MPAFPTITINDYLCRCLRVMSKSFVLITNSWRKSGDRDNRLIRKPMKASVISWLGSKAVRLSEIYEALRIDSAQMKSAQNLLKELVPEYLDVNKRFRDQDQMSVESLKRELQRRMPSLNRYEDGWGAEVLIRRVVSYRHSLVNCKCRSHPRVVATRPTMPTPASTSLPAPVLARARAPTSLEEFLHSVEPNSSHLLFLLARHGLSDDRFTEFIALPPDYRKAFIRLVFHGGQVPDKYIQGVLAAAEKLSH